MSISKIKEIKIREDDGSYSVPIPIGADAINVDTDDGRSVQDILNNQESIISNNINLINTLQQSVQGLASGSPKGSYAAVSALVSANPETGVYVIQENGHIYSWTKNASEAIDLGLYQSALINEKYFENYVSYDSIHGLVDKTEYGFISTNLGSITNSSIYYTTDYIRVWSGNTYLCLGNIRKFLFYSNDKNPITGSYIDEKKLNYTFTANQDGFIRVTFYVNVGQYHNNIINITGLDIDNIDWSKQKLYKLNNKVELGDTQSIEVENLINNSIGYDSENVNPYRTETGKYMIFGNTYWDTTVNTIDTMRFNVKKGDRFFISTYTYKSISPYSLFGFNGTSTTILYQHPSSGEDTFTSFNEVITIDDDEIHELCVTSYGRYNDSLSYPIVNLLLNKEVVSIKMLEEAINSTSSNDNILYGKKYIACGDSFTAGDFSSFTDENGNSGINSDYLYDSEMSVYKTYPYWIAKRNNMTLINEAINGSTMTNSDNNSNVRFSYTRYKNIPLDADYITLKFGINDSHSHQNMPIGTINDTETNTFFGAWNTVLTWIITNIPKAKIGIIIGNGLDGNGDEEYCEAMRNIAKSYGIPYLDEDLDDQVPFTFRTNKNINSSIKSLRTQQFRVSNTNGHPNIECHKYESTFVENFLRSL